MPVVANVLRGGAIESDDLPSAQSDVKPRSGPERGASR